MRNIWIKQQPLVNKGVTRVKIDPSTFFPEPTREVVNDIADCLNRADGGISMDWMKSYIEHLHSIPALLAYMMARHMSIDVDNELIFSPYNAKNAPGKTLTADHDMYEYLCENVFPQ